MAMTMNQLGRNLLAQIYEILSGGDETVPASPNTFVSWCCPGIPFAPDEFQFAASGLGSGETAEKEKVLLQQAYNFATLVDFIPDRSGVYDGDRQQAIWRVSQARMSQMYGEVLRASKVVTRDLTDAEKAKLERFRGLLRTTRKVKDIITDEEKEVVEDGPMLKAYQARMAEYLAAALEYSNKRVAAQSATGVEGKAAVTDFANNAHLYRLKVKAAMDAWVGSGYRNEVDQVSAYINQVTQRSMQLWKQRLLEDFDGAVVTGLGPGQEFRYTTLMPGSFATSAGWTRFSHSHTQTQSSSRRTNTSWSGSAGVGFGLFRFGASAGGSSSSLTENSTVSEFSISFELTQTPIARGWFYPEFFINRGWMLRPGEGWMFDAMPSDGAAPPAGVLAAYPTSILFARNIVIRSADFARAYSEFSRSVSGGGSVGWGPFSIGGKYQRGSSGHDLRTEATGNEVRVPGLQILAFINHIVPKAPNPLPGIADAEFQ